MDLDEYDRQLVGFADALDVREGNWEGYLPGLFGASQDAEDCVTLRQAMLTDQDRERCRPYLEIGFFPAPDKDRRLAWWAFAFEVCDRDQNRALERSCALYNRCQPLFVGAPKLFDHIRKRQTNGQPDLELIDSGAVLAINDSEIYVVGPGYGKLAQQLDAQIPVWARKEFPQAPLFLRLDPSRHFKTQPLQALFEASIVPADPRWMKTLALFPEMTAYAQYELLGDLEQEGMEAYRDYALRHVRRLEIRATRTDPDYLSMILEELPRPDESNGLMIGRCIHLDTRAPWGTPIRDAVLQHLDLAINVYRDGDRALRMSNTLQHGKSQSATYRTHLLRIEAVPFTALFGFAEMFFKSNSLLKEWLAEVLPSEPQEPEPVPVG